MFDEIPISTIKLPEIEIVIFIDLCFKRKIFADFNLKIL